MIGVEAPEADARLAVVVDVPAEPRRVHVAFAAAVLTARYAMLVDEVAAHVFPLELPVVFRNGHAVATPPAGGC